MNLHNISTRLMGAIVAIAITAAFASALVVDSGHVTDVTDVTDMVYDAGATAVQPTALAAPAGNPGVPTHG